MKALIDKLRSEAKYRPVFWGDDRPLLIQAADAIESLETFKKESEEEGSEIVTTTIDPTVGVPFMRCSPGLPKYVQKLEKEIAELERTVQDWIACHEDWQRKMSEAREAFNQISMRAVRLTELPPRKSPYTPTPGEDHNDVRYWLRRGRAAFGDIDEPLPTLSEFNGRAGE